MPPKAAATARTAKSGKSVARPSRKTAEAPDLGSLPEWNLADLYRSIDAPEFKRDLDRAEAECVAFEKAYKGRLEELAAGSQAG
jgi:oligoendopeptidase F